MASTLDVKVVKNNDIGIQFFVKDKFGQPQNITDFQIKWQVKKSAKAIPLITKTIGSGIEITSPDAGVFLVRVNASDTANLAAGSYFHEATVTDPSGKSITLTDLGLGVGVFFLREEYAQQD